MMNMIYAALRIRTHKERGHFLAKMPNEKLYMHIVGSVQVLYKHVRGGANGNAYFAYLGGWGSRILENLAHSFATYKSYQLCTTQLTSHASHTPYKQNVIPASMHLQLASHAYTQTSLTPHQQLTSNAIHTPSTNKLCKPHTNNQQIR